VLSGISLCDELITRPEESSRLWCVVVCNFENLKNEEAMTRVGSQRHKNVYMLLKQTQYEPGFKLYLQFTENSRLLSFVSLAVATEGQYVSASLNYDFRKVTRF
jgi:hypothetical protein